MTATPTYIVRIWLDDRPGALGRVASRIGALRGDGISLEIVERQNGRAVDELVIEVPSHVSTERIGRELRYEDGVMVEVRRLAAIADLADTWFEHLGQAMPLEPAGIERARAFLWR